MKPAVVRTEAVIDAPPEQVWAVLADLATWHEWNPTFIDVEPGAMLQVGATIRMKLRLLGRPGGLVAKLARIPMRQEVRVVNPPRELAWHVRQAMPSWLADVARSFLLDPTEGGRTRFVQTDRATGPLAGLVFGAMGRAVGRGFDDLARALAARVATHEGT